MNGMTREMKVKSGELEAMMTVEGNEWWVITRFFAVDKVPFAGSEQELQRVGLVNEFHDVC